MDVRDMARSAWTRIRSKQQIIRDFAWGEYLGKVSLLKILDITAPLIRSYEGHEVLLADTGYYWLQLAIHGSHAWFTVMFDARGKLIQIYVDVTDGNDALKDNPTFSDLYLNMKPPWPPESGSIRLWSRRKTISRLFSRGSFPF